MLPFPSWTCNLWCPEPHGVPPWLDDECSDSLISCVLAGLCTLSFTNAFWHPSHYFHHCNTFNTWHICAYTQTVQVVSDSIWLVTSLSCKFARCIQQFQLCSVHSAMIFTDNQLVIRSSIHPTDKSGHYLLLQFQKLIKYLQERGTLTGKQSHLIGSQAMSTS